MKFTAAFILLSLSLSIVTASPVPVKKPAKAAPAKAAPAGGPAHVYANINPQKAPQTAQNIIEHVQKHGAASMTTTVGALNSKADADKLRQDAIGNKKVPGKVIDEEPPASFRKPGDPVTTKETPKSEGNHQGGVLSAAIQKAKKLGPGTLITHGVEGVDLNNLPPRAVKSEGKHHGGVLGSAVKKAKKLGSRSDSSDLLSRDPRKSKGKHQKGERSAEPKKGKKAGKGKVTPRMDDISILERDLEGLLLE